MEWIKCSDRLPFEYKDGMVLTVSDNNHMQVATYHTITGGSSYWAAWPPSNMVFFPTHWMELPPPPK